MIENRFIYYKNKSDFNSANISDKSIVFIEDSKEIYTHGIYFKVTKISELENDSNYITSIDSKNYTDAAIANLVDSAPDTLNTLNELAVALTENKNVTEILDNAITNKADKTEIPTKTSLLENDSDYITNADLQTKPDIITRTITSEADGKIDIELIEGYTFLNAIAYNNGYPLVTIRFGNYYYVGYYGGTEEPNAETAITLMFTGKAGIEVTVYYISI